MSSDNLKINVALDKPLWDAGVKFYHTLSLSSASWLVFGASNSGKSVLVKTIVGRCASIPGARVTICDGKAFDYRFLRNVDGARYFEHVDCSRGLHEFFREFTERMTDADAESYSPRIIVLEEWSSFLRTLEADKETQKVAKQAMSELFSITSQGRAYNTHALVSLQRPDASFLSGFRENLTTTVGLGRISPEAARMVGFNEYAAFNNEFCNQGQGWLLDDTGKFAQIIVPRIQDFNKLHRAIVNVTTR
jgi:hypothetical protein